MKTKLLFISFLMIAFFANAQGESTYLQYNFNTPQDIHLSWSYSSEYFDGNVWFFISGEDEIYYHPMTVSDEGKLEDMDHHSSFCPACLPITVLKLNTVVVNQRLYLFYYNIDNPYPGGAFWYARIFEDAHHHLMKDENLNMSPEHKFKMTAAALNDTVYLFYTEKHTGYIKYFRGVPKENYDEIQWLSNEPTAIEDSAGNPLKSYGNVAACTYFTPDNKERIMFLYPSEKFNDHQNYLVFYSGIGNQYAFHHKIESHLNTSLDWTAKFVSMAQGTVKGGLTKRYMMQAAYVTKGESLSEGFHVEMFIHEFDLTSGLAGGLEQIPVHGSALLSMAPDFMEYYIPDGNAKEIRKYLYLVGCFDLDPSAQVTQWDSDILRMIGHTTEFSPDYLKEELWHLICVVEGPPPYVLNGHTMVNLWNHNHYPPSSFNYGQETTHTVGSNTTYKKTIEASGGFGPLSGGFKRAMQHNNHNSTTDITKLSVMTTIKPPLGSEDEEGLMINFYDATSLMRTQWRLHDYNGDTLNVEHSLFLFNFTEPQLRPVEKSFTEYSKSPRLDSIETYVERKVDYFPGMQTIQHTSLLEDLFGGVGQIQTIHFDTIYTNTSELTKTIKVGIDAKYKIFSINADQEVTLEYTTENNTENNHGFDLTYNLPYPTDSADPKNVRKYYTIPYLMRTTDSTAYFLPDGFKKYRPLFVTWEVSDIEYGPFTEFIDDKILAEKYRFNCFPNPASGNCYFRYELPESSDVQLILYTAMGQHNDILVNNTLSRGQHHIDHSVKDLPAGLYFYKLRIGKDVLDGKLMVVH